MISLPLLPFPHVNEYEKPKNHPSNNRNIHTRNGKWVQLQLEVKKNVFALKLNKLEKVLLFFFSVLCCCCTCEGIWVSRGKKSFVHVMLLCTFFLCFSCVCLFIAFYIILLFLHEESKKEVQSLPPQIRRQKKKSGKNAKSKQKGNLCLLCPKCEEAVFQFTVKS